VLGGPAGSGSRFGEAEARRLLDRALRMKAQVQGGLVVTPSRRTPEAAIALFAAAAARDPAVWTWPRQGDNPYLGVLALADRLVVTGDSVSMVSEALATPHPVEVFAEGLRPRHRRFVATLEERGLVRPFDGVWREAGPREPVDATAEAAQAVRRLLASR
jgi:mitochondrial fission protein ELM1